MSNVTDRAAEEAARAEAEQENEPVTPPDEGAAPGDDDEANEAAEQEEGAGESPETEDVPQSSETTMEQRSKQLAAAHKSFTTRISTVMEEDANALQPCPLCWPMTQGFVWPGMPLEEERKLAVKMVMGEYGADQYEEDPAREQCPQCKGRGMLKTGSLVQGQDALKETAEHVRLHTSRRIGGRQGKGGQAAEQLQRRSVRGRRRARPPRRRVRRLEVGQARRATATAELATRQQAGRLRPALAQHREPVIDLVDVLGERGPVLTPAVTAEDEVLLHRRVGEHPPTLGHVGHAE